MNAIIVIKAIVITGVKIRQVTAERLLTPKTIKNSFSITLTIKLCVQYMKRDILNGSLILMSFLIIELKIKGIRSDAEASKIIIIIFEYLLPVVQIINVAQ